MFVIKDFLLDVHWCTRRELLLEISNINMGQLGSLLVQKRGARLTKSGSHPDGIIHQDAIQCRTGMAAQRGLSKEAGQDKGVK
ncbi:hypothetical protein DSO57_1035998 [Entomophthora muscae]|uniref:Uncharacterized protein n=1 Tax=Entomophthora muscae TaxID=34485 RepID=A0ACC2U9T2_9FUNG|nr:hypothetical protein DSO57_1035998 [Entomophthora muscae]